MSDPSYDNGIDADSVVNMVSDIGDVILGKSNYITAPQPCEGVGPMTHIAFKDDTEPSPQGLEIRQRRSSTKSVSRRSQSYSVAHGGHVAQYSQPPVKRLSQPVESIIVDIDDAMNMVGMQDNQSDDDNEVADDDNESTHSPVITQHITEEPSDIREQEIVGRPAGRRFIRRANRSS